MTEARAAATLLVVRDGSQGIEVVMGKRPPGGPFGDVWVFPGGAVDTEDFEVSPDPDTAWRLAALRETWEEVGLALTDPEGMEIPTGPGSVHIRMRTSGIRFATARLVYLSNWVTPRMISKRFDTRFFLTAADGELRSSDELAGVDWIPAHRAVSDHDLGGFPMIFPTLSHLRYISGFESVAALFVEARSLDVIPAVEPRPFERGLIVDNDPRFGA